ncbi:MAG TPA: hypothetical protein VG454_01115 [Gemmatimonadales bacterium]|nr:hypothetical protein [Gemmatimonadales bacterium]
MLALVASLAIGASRALIAQTDSTSVRRPGRLTVDTIIIINRNIFDSADAAPDWFANLANSLHRRTRQWVIRRRLLLNPGDPFDLARMEESERMLRSLEVFRSVRVDTVRVNPGDKLAIRAVTADGWSTQPRAGYANVGGDVTWQLGFVERNFLGTATEVALVYEKNPDRRRLDLAFINPHFFGRRTLLETKYSHLSDGQLGEWLFGLPFHETAAPHSVETFGQVADERVLSYRDDSLILTQWHRLLRVGLTGGVGLHPNSHSYRRLWGTWEWRRENFADSGTTPFPYSVFTTVRAGIDVGSARFRVLEHFNSYARREDVDLSPSLRLGAVLESGLGYEAHAQASTVWTRGFAEVQVDANAGNGGGSDSSRTRAGLTVVSQNIARHTLIAHAEGGLLTNPKPGREFDPWLEQRSPRLFGIHNFTGTRMTWFVLEDRILVADEMFGLLAFGLAPFLDYGGAWYADEAPRQGGNAGVSLRFGPTRAVRGEAAELAFGYRFGQGVNGRRWGATLRKGFSF